MTFESEKVQFLHHFCNLNEFAFTSEIGLYVNMVKTQDSLQ